MTSGIPTGAESLTPQNQVKLNQSGQSKTEENLVKNEEIVAKNEETVVKHEELAIKNEELTSMMDSSSSMDGISRDDGCKVQKRKERLEQNRISARESRKRKKTMIEELQRTVITLSRENKDLNLRNESLRRQLVELGTKRSYSLQVGI